MKKRISALLLLFLFFSILPMKIFAANVPINPWDYAQKLGKGLDVDWSKTKAMLMNSVDNIAYNNGTLEKEFHYFTI